MTSAPLESDHFPCAQCGADLRFEPGENILECDYCAHKNHIDTDGEPIQELDFRKAIANQLSDSQTETTNVAECSSCGATVEFDPNLHADDCPFCTGPLIIDTSGHRHLKPKGVLPFAIDGDEAKISLKKWLGSRWFAPSALKKYARTDQKMNGLYTPYWTFDADTHSTYRGQRGDVYYIERTVTVMTDKGPRKQRRRVPQIRWTRVSGRVRRWFDDVLILGSKSLPERFADDLAPWDLHAILPYRTEYLAGFRAEAYTIDLREGFAEARANMDLTIRRDVRFDIGGDQQRVDHISTDFSDVTFKHILLPIWIAAYRYRGKTYRFIVNGRTGRIRGERPYSPWKIIAAVLFGAIMTALLFSLLYGSGALDQMTHRTGFVYGNHP